MQGINFRPNIKGTGQPMYIGFITGTIVLEEDTASKFIPHRSFYIITLFLTTVLSDISNFRQVTISEDTGNAALNIYVIPESDTISLEFDERIILRFTPFNPALTPEAFFLYLGGFLRDFTVVHILDDDCEYCAYIANVYSSMFSIHVITNPPIRNMPNMLGRNICLISYHKHLTCWCM